MTKQEYIQQMPKIDLHCHLDGSLPASTIRKLANNANIPIPDSETEFMNLITVSQECTDLTEYLSRFHLPISCLQSAESLFTASHDLLGEVSKENVIYLEVRFAPFLSVNENLSLDGVIESVLQGLESGRRKFGVEYGVILCALRNHPHKTNVQLVSAAIKYGKRGVVALDLAGNEKTFATQEHQSLFQEAVTAGIAFTIHAGEAAGPSSVWDAVTLGAKRIGHGIAMKDDPDLVTFCRDNNIGIELCPTSNLQTKAASNWESYPYPLFMKGGLPVTINTDNRTVSKTTLTQEFLQLDTQYDLDTGDLETLFKNAVDQSFTSDSQKRRLHGALDKFKQQKL